MAAEGYWWAASLDGCDAKARLWEESGEKMAVEDREPAVIFGLVEENGLCPSGYLIGELYDLGYR